MARTGIAVVFEELIALITVPPVCLFHLIFRVNASMCTGQRHIHIAEHLAKYTSKPKFLSRLNMEQTLVEGENYDAYVSGPLIAPLFFTKKLVGSSRSSFPVDHFGTLYCAVHLHMWKR